MQNIRLGCKCSISINDPAYFTVDDPKVLYKIGLALTVNVRPSRKCLPVKNAPAYFTIVNAVV